VEIYLLYDIMQILGTQGAYQYNVYAKPLGYVRQSFQATADDLDFQNDIGSVTQKKIVDPLCFTLAQCQLVADFERDIVKFQRSRIKIPPKIAHLKDEEGDTIQMAHPYSGDTMTLFITDLTRRFKKPNSAGANDGYFYDDLEAWVIG
jgi:hypothetical protein